MAVRKEGNTLRLSVSCLEVISVSIYTSLLYWYLSLSARLIPVATGAHLPKTISASTILVNTQVFRLSKETSNIIASQSDFDVAKQPSFIDALGYEDFLNHEHPALAGLQVPPVYVHNELGGVIMHSSGTTGLPKPIYHAPSYLLLYAACHRTPEKMNRLSTICPLFHYTTSGFGLLAPSLAPSIGMPCILPPASIILTARSTLAALNYTKARYMMSVPPILEDMLIMKELDALPVLKTLDFIAIGGAPMKEHIGSELVANGVKLLNHWGKFIPYNTISPLLTRTTTGTISSPALTSTSKTTVEHPAVKDVLTFGEGRASLIGISEAFAGEYSSPEGEAKFMETFNLYVEHGNDITDSHGKISMNMIVLTNSSTKPLLRTDKGSLAGKANYPAFEKEIKDCCNKAESAFAGSVDPLPVLKDGGDDEELRKVIRDLILSCTQGKADFILMPGGDTVDFFEVGIDSLQATCLCMALQNPLKAAALNLPTTLADLPLDF
ncbi:hypothetical protein BYT27DRAFT_7253353 [Phlegmacium glaucopus]|nr:hypothetical protein BYT27DRAFT_7253353 [Phlegmacium glaucopus]